MGGNFETRILATVNTIMPKTLRVIKGLNLKPGTSETMHFIPHRAKPLQP